MPPFRPPYETTGVQMHEKRPTAEGPELGVQGHSNPKPSGGSDPGTFDLGHEEGVEETPLGLPEVFHDGRGS